MRILITGSSGQLGTDLQTTLTHHELTVLPHSQLDIGERASVDEAFSAYRPDVVINTAAYHKVDECEAFPEKTFSVNTVAPRNLAEACDSKSAKLVHFSTNFVFDGNADQPYTEEDSPAPLSVYGVSKLSGEHLVRATSPKHLIVRTTGLYGKAGSGSAGKGLNFVELMIKLGRERGKVTVVDDQIMTPTATADLAQKVATLVEDDVIGTYHITNSGACSYAEFARSIFEKVGIKADVTPTTTAEYNSPARRPLYSVLDNSRLHELGGPPLRLWEEALQDYLESRCYL